MADLFKPMTDAFVELWLDGEKVRTYTYVASWGAVVSL